MAEEEQLNLANPKPMTYQGIGIRFVALLIDTIILSIVLGVIFGALASIIGESGSGLLSLLTFILYMGIYIGYYTYLEGSRGQTIGKMVTKIKVVGEDGTPITMNQSFTRNILRIIDGLFSYLVGAILIWRSDKQQRLGDSIAKTVVVKA